MQYTQPRCPINCCFILTIETRVSVTKVYCPQRYYTLGCCYRLAKHPRLESFTGHHLCWFCTCPKAISSLLFKWGSPCLLSSIFPRAGHRFHCSPCLNKTQLSIYHHVWHQVYYSLLFRTFSCALLAMSNIKYVFLSNIKYVFLSNIKYVFYHFGQPFHCSACPVSSI